VILRLGVQAKVIQWEFIKKALTAKSWNEAAKIIVYGGH
jgi:hypothetical protein